MEIAELEQLALGVNRAAALDKLLPGTVDHDYWRGVFLQHAGRLDEVDAILAGWIKRHGHGHDEHRVRLERRQLLLRAGMNLPAYAEELRRRANVEFNDRAEVVVQAQRFPTKLNPALIETNLLVKQEVARRPDLSTITDHGLPDIIALIQDGDISRRRSLLQRLTRANLPRIVDLIAADLVDPSSGGFGSLSVHTMLTLAQLDDLATRLPALRTHTTWVDAVLMRLRPPSWVDLRIDLAERRAFLDSLWAFVATLAPTFNSLKAQVLYRLLELDRMQGTYDRGRFLTYLELPRNAAWVSRDWVSRIAAEHLVQPGAMAGRAAGLEPIGDDEPLVRDYLARFLREEGASAFTGRLRVEWLDEVLATTRLLSGASGVEAERWAKILGPARLTALRDRVDIDLAPQNRPFFGAADDVHLEVDVKNVRELEVKVFRINTLAYFVTKNNAEVDTSLDLDGMIPSGDAIKLDLGDVPLHRKRQRIALPMCARPGTYVVELIGNGRSSRALIRKGSLRHAVRIGAAGAVITVMDENGVVLPDARIWLGGRELRSRAQDGNITIPFSTRPGRTPILLVHGDVTQRETLDHPSEAVQLQAGFRLERESVIPNQMARILCRPTLTMAGAQVTLALIEEPRVEIIVTDLAGTSSSRTMPVVLHDDQETVIELNVPDGVVQLAVYLRGRVRVISTQQTVDVSDGSSAQLNVIHTTEQTATMHLADTEGPRRSLHVYGKTGEPLAGRAVSLTFYHRKVSSPVTTTLETDEWGAIDLGSLDLIDRITAALPKGSQRTWWLVFDTDTPRLVQTTEGEAIELPVADGARTQDLSLMELRSNAPARDMIMHASIVDRCVLIQKLPPGEYRFSCRGVHAHVAITVAPRQQPDVRSGWAVAGRTMIELTPAAPLIRGVAREGDHLVLRLTGAGPLTRVHAIATRYRLDPILPSYLTRTPYVPLSARNAPGLAQYISGRDIGDEYRYVLERRSAPRRPGTMLDKPSLLLNPWALRATATSTQHASFGGAYAAQGMSPAPLAGGRMMSEALRSAEAQSAEQPGFPSVDFLARNATLLSNLKPGPDGSIRVPLSDLGGGQLVRFMVIDPALTSAIDVALPAQAHAPRDLRLRLALDPAQHFAEDRSVVAAPAGTSIVIPDVRTGKVELISTTARAHQLLLTLSEESELREMSFITEWASLDDATKRTRYSKYACHEVNLFLWKKDKAFFEAVVRPYLAHKLHLTFIDRFLLGNDLSGYLEPWAFGQLNTVERILLGASIPQVKDAVARLVGDAVDMIPPDPERDSRLVSTLLGASALEKSDLPQFAAEESEAYLALDRDDDADTGAMMKSRVMASESLPRPRPAAMPPAAMAPGMAMPPPQARRMSSMAGGGAGYAAPADLLERAKAEPLYRGADKTQEWAETGYWKKRVEDVDASLIPPNRFWRDLAKHSTGEPFLSPHLGDCVSSFAEAMFALAFLDLPFAAEAPEAKLEDMSLTVTPRSHALAARTRITEIQVPAARSAILIGQSYFRSDDRFEWDGAEQREKYVSGEMIAGVVYRCQVVVTNPTRSRQKLDVLLQIPRGAVAVASGFFTRTQNIELNPYGTQSLEYAFYFPRPGRYTHFPAHVTKGLELQTFAEPRELEVVLQPTTVDHGSWSHISQHGSLDDVVAFLDRANLGRIDLGRIAWRMHDRAAFDRILTRLAARHIYEPVLWRYALAHHDGARAAEWLRHQDSFIREAGPALDEAGLGIDPVARGWYEHLEYAPLINARAHQLGARRRILNEALNEQYRSFLDTVAHRVAVSPHDLLAGVHYLLCMDRVDDALAILDRIPPESITTRLQYDYLAAYGACYRGDLERARALTEPWVGHPVDRWRNRFAALKAMLDEISLTTAHHAPPTIVDEDHREQRMTESAAKQPALEIKAERGEIVLSHHNLESCELRFFRMDIELVFSRQPFVQGDVERFSFIEPGHRIQATLSESGTTVVPIPEALRGSNLVIEAIAPSLRKSIAHYAHDLTVQLANAYGQVRVIRASTQAPLAATYVKVYGRQPGGQTQFFKDGYTDLRGRFDYATLSTDDLDRVERFAILVVSDEAGATIVEAQPPPR